MRRESRCRSQEARSTSFTDPAASAIIASTTSASVASRSFPFKPSEEGRALVPVVEGVCACEPEGVGRSEGREVAVWFAVPLVLGPYERSLEGALVSDTEVAAVLAELIEVGSFDDDAGNPPRLLH